MIKIPKYFKDYLAKPDETLYEHTRYLLLELEKLDKLHKLPYKNLIELACLYHDIGKINPLFSKRMINNEKFNENKEIGHNILSFFLFYFMVRSPELSEEDLIIVSYAILNHHFYVNNFEILYDEKKKILIEENLNLILKGKDGNKFNPKRITRTLSEIRNEKNYMNEKFILVKGILNKCDYSASAHTEIEYGTYDLKNKLEGLGYIWNDMQKFAEKNKDNNIIIIGSTGLGKTEAALKWLDNNKGFYVLPLKTAINSMYLRIKKELYPNDYENKLSLLHSNTQNIYISQFLVEEKNLIEPKEENKFWEYYHSSKNMALPLTITTPDQLFRFVFKFPGFEMPLSTYSYSKIIIDEIQAYNSKILAFMIYGIQKIIKIGGKIAIITATLAPFIKDFMKKCYNESGNLENFNFNFIEEEYINEKIRHKLNLIDKEICTADIINFYKKEKNRDSMKILIVMNTVKDAQNTYKELKKSLGNEIDIKLLHARYILRDRNKKEKEILLDGLKDVKKHIIWISTQIVEASLDIDFDYLFTEYAELNSLFQRMGRCNRAGLKTIDIPNIYIYLKIKESYLRDDFIDETLHILGKEGLIKWAIKKEKIISEKEKIDMIKSYYTTENIKGSKFMTEYNRSYSEIVNLKPYSLTIFDAKKLFRNILSIKIIPKKVYEENKFEIEELDKIFEEYKKLIKRINKIIKNLNSKNTKFIALKKKLIGEKNKLQFETIKISDKLSQFSLNIGYFQGLIKKQNEKLLCNEKFWIIEGNYSYEIGFSSEIILDKEEISI